MLFNHASLLGISYYLLSVLYSKLNWLQSLCYDLVMTFVSTRSLSSYECKRTFIEKNGFDLTLVAKIISQILQIQPVLDQCPYEQISWFSYTCVSVNYHLDIQHLTWVAKKTLQIQPVFVFLRTSICMPRLYSETSWLSYLSFYEIFSQYSAYQALDTW